MTSVLHSNQKIVADGSGNFSFESRAYYPADDDQKVDFYAVNPFKTSQQLTSVMSFSVNTDQTSDKGYTNSDLMYAKRTNVEKTKKDVELTFRHKLSKISFVVKQGDGTSLKDLSNIQLRNVYTDVNIDLTDGTLIPVASTVKSINANGVEGSGEAEVDGMAVVIVPQTFVADGTKEFLAVTVDGKEHVYTPTEDMYFETGSRYNFVITVYDNGISVSHTEMSWDE